MEGWNPSFVALLDFSTLTMMEDISQRFRLVAQELLCNSTLSVVQNGTYTDLRRDSGIGVLPSKAHFHEDPFTHEGAEQGYNGWW